MKTAMATRNPTNVKGLLTTQTDFVLHKVHRLELEEQKNVVDYTEYRLLRYAAAVKDAQQRQQLYVLISDYRAGLVAIAWAKGQPVYVKVTKEKS